MIWQTQKRSRIYSSLGTWMGLIVFGGICRHRDGTVERSSTASAAANIGGHLRRKNTILPWLQEDFAKLDWKIGFSRFVIHLSSQKQSRPWSNCPQIKVIRNGRPHGCPNGFGGCGHPYGYPRPVTIYLDIYMDIHPDVRVELFVPWTVRPGERKLREAYGTSNNSNLT